MGNLIIKGKGGAGNKLILQDQAGGAVVTTADSGATIANATLNSPTLVTPALGTPASGVATNITGIPAAQVSGVLPVGVTGGTGLGGQQYCTAWTNYNHSTDTGYGTYGLSSTTSISTGVVRLTFTSALASANYAMFCMVGQLDTSSTGPSVRVRAQATTYCEVTTVYYSSGWQLLNWIRNCICVFGP